MREVIVSSPDKLSHCLRWTFLLPFDGCWEEGFPESEVAVATKQTTVMITARNLRRGRGHVDRPTDPGTEREREAARKGILRKDLVTFCTVQLPYFYEWTT